MTLLRFDPFRSFEHTARRMSQVMNDLEKGVNFDYGSFKPRVDIAEDSAKVYVYAELAGLSKDQIKILVDEDNVLVIKGEKKPNRAETATIHKSEVFYGNFERRFILPENLNKESIKAKYENGLLELTIDKVEPPKPKEIEVSL